MNNGYFLHSNQFSHTICDLNCTYPYISGLDDSPRDNKRTMDTVISFLLYFEGVGKRQQMSSIFLFATNKCNLACNFGSHHAYSGQCGAYFHVRVFSYIDNTIVLIAGLFAAINLHIFKIKVLRFKTIFY